MHERSLALYETLGHGFAYPAEPVGALVLSDDPEPLRRECDELAARFPEVAPEWLEGAALRAAEPGLGEGLYAYRLETGRPVPPAVGDAGLGRAGARGRRRAADRRGGRGRRGPRRARDRRAHGRGRRAGRRRRARRGPLDGAARKNGAGHLSCAAVGRERRGAAPRPAAARARAGRDRGAGRRGRRRAVDLLDRHRGRRVRRRVDVPARRARPRSCARRSCSSAARATCRRSRASARSAPAPARGRSRTTRARCSARTATIEGLHLATGHGAWGISLGPGSAELVAAAILEGGEIPPELAASRV